MLKEFYNLLSVNNLLITDSICNLPKSTCNSQQLVIDFDHIKDTFCSQMKISSLKSADALVIDQTKQTITFLELKDLEQLIIRNSGSFSNVEDFISSLKSKFDDFKIHDKIVDSHILILAIAGFYNMNKLFYKDFLDKSKIKINFLLVVSISSQDYLKYRISNLANIKSNKFRFLNNFNIIRCDDLDLLLKT